MNTWNGIIKSITKLYFMTQVLTSIWRHLQLFIADLISSDILAHVIHWVSLRMEPHCHMTCWSKHITKTKSSSNPMWVQRYRLMEHKILSQQKVYTNRQNSNRTRFLFHDQEFSFLLFNWVTLHARLNSHYEEWNYKKTKRIYESCLKRVQRKKVYTHETETHRKI